MTRKKNDDYAEASLRSALERDEIQELKQEIAEIRGLLSVFGYRSGYCSAVDLARRAREAYDYIVELRDSERKHHDFAERVMRGEVVLSFRDPQHTGAKE